MSARSACRQPIPQSLQAPIPDHAVNSWSVVANLLLFITALDIDALATFGVLLDLLLESTLNRIDDLVVAGSADEADSNALGPETTGTTDAVQVGVCALGKRFLGLCVDILGGGIWHVVIDGEVDTLDVDTTTEDVRADADALVVILEGSVALDTVALISLC